MSDVCIGQIEETPITWQPANTNCPVCGQPQYYGFQGTTYVGTSCPNGHWVAPNVVQSTATQPVTQEAQPTTVVDWSKDIPEDQIETFNKYQEACEQLTNQMKVAYLQREQYRQAIADMTCPFTVGMCIETGTGTAPKDRKVITKVSGGNTLNGEYWRAWCRVLKKSGQLGEKPYRVHPSDKGFRIKGMFQGVEGLPVENIEEDKII